MKSLFATLLLALMLPLSANAYFTPNVQFNIQPYQVAAQVYNHTGSLLYCQGYVYGMTQTGVYYNAWFADYVPPMQYRYAYVYSSYPYYFVNAWADIRCQ
ncbi:MAG: hypothetical protein ACLGGX_06035 [Bdellovibrionia bacterium]